MTIPLVVRNQRRHVSSPLLGILRSFLRCSGWCVSSFSPPAQRCCLQVLLVSSRFHSRAFSRKQQHKMDSLIKLHYRLGGWFILNIRLCRGYSVYSLQMQLCEKDKMQGRPLAPRNGRMPKLYHRMSKFDHNKEERQTKKQEIYLEAKFKLKGNILQY